MTERQAGVQIVHLPRGTISPWLHDGGGFAPRLLLLQGCRAIDNYTDSLGPCFSGSHAGLAPNERAIFKAVSFNIAFGEHYEQATEEIQGTPALADADALLLQEMDPDGVQAMTRVLQYNYVYYPASVHKHGKGFGNAELAPGLFLFAELSLLARYDTLATRWLPPTGQLGVAIEWL